MGNTNPNSPSDWSNMFIASIMIYLSSPLSNPLIDLHKTSTSNAHLSERSSAKAIMFAMIESLTLLPEEAQKVLIFSSFVFIDSDDFSLLSISIC